MNVVLCRVLYAHALVAAPRTALGWLELVAPFLGDPRLGMTGIFLSLSRVLPRVAFGRRFLHPAGAVDRSMGRRIRQHREHPVGGHADGEGCAHVLLVHGAHAPCVSGLPQARLLPFEQIDDAAQLMVAATERLMSRRTPVDIGGSPSWHQLEPYGRSS